MSSFPSQFVSKFNFCLLEQLKMELSKNVCRIPASCQVPNQHLIERKDAAVPAKINQGKTLIILQNLQIDLRFKQA